MLLDTTYLGLSFDFTIIIVGDINTEDLDFTESIGSFFILIVSNKQVVSFHPSSLSISAIFIL